MAKKSGRRVHRLTLGKRGGIGQVRVGIEAFFEFSFWLSEELEDLVGYWSKKMPRSVGRRAGRCRPIVSEE